MKTSSKLKKPDRKWHKVYDSIYMKYLEWENPYRLVAYMGFQEMRGRGEWEVLLSGYRVSVWGDEQLWNWIVVTVYNIVNVLVATELYTLK